jgi:predicted negative regulator of RcsB-dependent stress response
MDAEAQPSDVFIIKAMEWLHAHRKMLIIVAVGVAVLGLAWAVLAWKKDQDETDANAQFFAAPNPGSMRAGPVSPAPLLAVAKDYPGTAGGEHAQMLAAEEMFAQGQYPEAYAQFSDFLANYKDSPLIPQAKIGAAACLEAEGKTLEAISRYHDITLTYPTEMNIVSPAKLTLARLYEEVVPPQPQQALGLYYELAGLLKQNPYDPWAAEAQERGQLLLAKHPELMRSAPAPAPSSGLGGLNLPETANPVGSPPATTPAPVVKPAPKPAPPAAPASNNIKLMTLPGASSNSTSKP